VTEAETITGRVVGGEQARRPALLILGCGNPFAGDDQAGLLFIQRLQARGESSCELRSMPQASVALLETFSQTDILLVVDAVRSGAPTGTLHLVPLPWPGVEPRGLSRLSGHGWGLKEVLDLASTLGRPIPRLLLLGVEVERMGPSAGLSPAVEQAVALAVERFEAVRDILLDPAASAWRSPQWFPPDDASFPAGSPQRDGAPGSLRPSMEGLGRSFCPTE
jgi:hydrogenase maturation protease